MSYISKRKLYKLLNLKVKPANSLNNIWASFHYRHLNYSIIYRNDECHYRLFISFIYSAINFKNKISHQMLVCILRYKLRNRYFELPNGLTVII